MRKIPTLFVRDEKLVIDKITPGCEWVLNEGRATRKFDGQCCKIDGGRYWRRREVKWHQQCPSDFVLAELDNVTGNQFGWVPVGMGKEDQYFREAIARYGLMKPDGTLYNVIELRKETEPPESFLSKEETKDSIKYEVQILKLLDGTYELCGPKVQGNPDKFAQHTLVKHGSVQLRNVPTTYQGLKDYLRDSEFEGIVWHHTDGRMVKIKRRDFHVQDNIPRRNRQIA